MSIELRPSSVGCDVRCSVCGQGFLLFSSRLAHLHHHQVVAHVQLILRRQHTDRDDPAAHPADGFCMPMRIDLLLASTGSSSLPGTEETTP